MSRAAAAFFMLVFAVGGWTVEIQAQTDKYVQIASSRRSSPVYYEAFSVPGRGEKEVVVVSYKVPHDRLVFMRQHEGSADHAFRAGLDIMVADTLLTFIEDCRTAGKCIVFSTHIMSEAERLCDRIGIIDRGKILATGSLKELTRQTGEQYLEKIFKTLVQGKNRESD